MTQLDRTQAPASSNIAELRYTLPETHTLPNGISAYCIDVAEQDLIRVDLLFDAGEWYQSMPLQASATVQMLNEGSANFTSAEIADKLDFYGSFTFFNTQKHTATITLYSLGKYLDKSLELLKDLLLNPTFPDKEFEIMMSQKHQQFKVDEEKVESVAAKQFMKCLFGPNHPYGRQISDSDFSKLTIKDLKKYHKQYYCSNNCKVIISGKVTQTSLETVTKYFGNKAWGKNEIPAGPDFTVAPQAVLQIYKERESAVQTALRIGLPVVNKKHPDYKGLQVLNTVLGGYFGSRLMSNIREEKGYTYGINSSLASLQDYGYFLISTQVKKEVRQDAINEIYKEIDRLCTEPIPDEELTIVKNYMLGQILRYFDGAFNLADTLKSLLDYDLDYSYYAEVVKAIQEYTPAALLDLAKKYFHGKDFIEISVG